MLEKQRKSQGEHHGSGPQGLPDMFSGHGQAGAATVSHGPYAEQLPVDGMTVREVRRRFGDRLDIDPASTAILDGHEAGEDAVVRAGQVLLFTRRAGEKGLRLLDLKRSGRA